MSGGMEDAAALGRLSNRLERAARELADAIKAAREGHRGLAIHVLSTVNDVLRVKESEYRLVQK